MKRKVKESERNNSGQKQQTFQHL